MAGTAPTPIKIVLEWRVRPGAPARFEEWAKTLMTTASRFRGLQGSSVLTSASSGESFILLRFASQTDLDRWQRSPEVTTMPARAQKTHDPTIHSTTTAAHLPKGFTEKSANVDGVKINYKIGGQGPVVVLLHGYTQTSHMWTPLMPRLATSQTVIAPDLRGAGGSARTQDGYDKKTLAKDIRGLVRQLGHEQIRIVGHDIGLMVAYAYAAQYPGEVSKVVLMDAFLPGVGDRKEVWLLRDLWHFHFYGETPLALVKGRERIYFEHFWNDFAADKTKSVPEADRRIYAAAYARANGMRAGFEYFKTFEQDAKDFATFSATKLGMPFLVLTGEKASGTFLIEQAKIVATNVSGTVVKGSGHWLMEEATDQVVPAIVAFLN